MRTEKIFPDDEVFYSTYAAGGGCGSVLAGESGLLEVRLPMAGPTEMVESSIHARFPRARRDSALSREAADLLARYFSREPVRFGLPIDDRMFTVFQRQVYRAVMGISYGSVKSYGEVAREILRPDAARGVGSAMARNPLPIIIPCHRVVGALGKMTGYSAPGGVVLKASLLLMEKEVLEAVERLERR
jgi:methylated-DNA-[protein]-cysteine S-methyltransferase